MSVENQASIFNRRASSAINKTGKKKREGGRDFEVEERGDRVAGVLLRSTESDALMTHSETRGGRRVE